MFVKLGCVCMCEIRLYMNLFVFEIKVWYFGMLSSFSCHSIYQVFFANYSNEALTIHTGPINIGNLGEFTMLELVEPIKEVHY